MDQDTPYIFLMIEKLAGTISKQDELLLDDLLAKDPDARKAWDDLKSQYPPEEVQRIKNKQWLPAEAITSRSQRNSKTAKKLIRYACMAAALMGFCVVLLLKFKNERARPGQPVAETNSKAAAIIKSKAITLTLGNGRVIDLAKENETILANNIRLNSTASGLSYDINTGINPYFLDYLNRRGQRHDAGMYDAVNILNVPAAKNYELTLSDGSNIKLNASSRVEFPFAFTGKNREVRLVEGEMYISVSPDPLKPFIVHTRYGTIRVLGTEFNVNCYDPGTVRVSLLKGAIQYQCAGKAVKIDSSCKEIIYSALNNDLQVQTFDKHKVLGWMSGTQYLHHTPLSRVAALLSRWYDVPVVIDNQPVGELVFSGVIQPNRPLGEFLENLATAGKVSYYLKGDTLHLK
jgi:ferric-dicitrate binding protein FerR (iron transport regulator)